jgi:hypothetical protein
MLDRLLAMLWVALFGAATGFAAGALAGAAVEFIVADAGEVILTLGSIGAVLGVSVALLVVAHDSRR